MPTYNISVVIDPADATSGARVVEAKLVDVQKAAANVDTAVQRAFDFNTGPAAAATSAVDKALDSVSNSATKAGQSATAAMGATATAATKATTALNGAAAAAANVAKQTAGAAQAGQTFVNSTQQVRQGGIILGEQFRQFSTSVLTGSGVLQAFAQQAGQAAFALQFFNGGLGKVGAFLSGPWGTILIIATTILGDLIGKLFESKDATDTADDAIKQFTSAQKDLGNYIDITTGKIKAQAGALTILARNAKVAQIATEQQAASKSRTDVANAVRAAGQTSTPGALGGIQQAFDPDLAKAVSASTQNGVLNVTALSTALLKLSRSTRPDLQKLAGDVTNLGGAALTSEANVKSLTGQVSDLDTVLKGGAITTTDMIKRQVELKNATTDVERARIRLNDVNSRASAIDKITDPTQRNAALKQYSTDLDSATSTLKRAEQAQKDAASATREHNTELREQEAAARKAAEALKQQAQFIERIANGNDKLENRGTQGEVNAKVADFTTQFRQAPNPDQKKQIADAVQRNQLLTDEKTVLDQVLGPLEQYQRQIAALDDLLAHGKVTQDDYNRSIAALPLQQKLDAVDKTLTGTLTQYDAQVKAIKDSIAEAIKVVDDAEKAKLIDPEDAKKRRIGLQGFDKSGGDIVVSGNDRSLQGQQLDQLNRQRQEPLRQLDLGLDNRPDLQKNAQKQGVNDDEKDNELKLLQAKNEGLLKSEQDYQDRLTAIKQKSEDDRKKIDDAATNVQLAAAQSTADSLLSVVGDLAGKKSAAYKAAFAIDKAFAIASSIIHIQQALASATASLPFPANLPVIATVAAEGASIIAAITSVAGQFRTGGYTGDGGEGEPAGVVHGKEFVMNARATRENRPLLEALNSGRTSRQAAVSRNDNDAVGVRPLHVNVDTTDIPGATAQIEYVTRDQARVMIKQGVSSGAPRAVSGQLQNPNSGVSKGIYRTTTARRKRA